MKKLMFILPLLSLIGITSCQETPVQEVTPFKSKEVQTFVDINNEGLQSLVNSKKEFILFVYQNGCMGCKLAEDYIEKFAEETDIIIYGIHYYEYHKVQNNTLNYPIVHSTPTFFFYENGEVFKSLEGVDSPNNNGYEKFVKLLDKYVDFDSKFYTLNKINHTSYELEGDVVSYDEITDESTQTLDEAILSNSKLNVVMSWNKCGDCKSLYSNYIYNGRLAKLKDPLYFFDVDFYRNNKPRQEIDDPINYAIWKNFALKYAFGTYYDGKVPSVVHFENGKPTEFVVYANEGKMEQDGDNYYFPNAQLEGVRKLRNTDKEALLNEAREHELHAIDAMLNL